MAKETLYVIERGQGVAGYYYSDASHWPARYRRGRYPGIWAGMYREEDVLRYTKEEGEKVVSHLARYCGEPGCRLVPVADLQRS